MSMYLAHSIGSQAERRKSGGGTGREEAATGRPRGLPAVMPPSHPSARADWGEESVGEVCSLC